MYNWYILNVPGGDAPPGQPRIVNKDQDRKCCEQLVLFRNSTMELLGVIDLQNPKCIKRIKQRQLCYAEKSPTVYGIGGFKIILWSFKILKP